MARKWMQERYYDQHAKSCPINGQVRRVQRLNMSSWDEPEGLKTSRKKLRKALKLDAGQNFSGCCSYYKNVLNHIDLVLGLVIGAVGDLVFVLGGVTSSIFPSLGPIS